SRRRHTRFSRDWSSDVCSSDLVQDIKHLAVTQYFNRRAVDLEQIDPFPSKALQAVFRILADAFQRIGFRVMNIPCTRKFRRDMRSEERRVGKEWRSGLSPYR